MFLKSKNKGQLKGLTNHFSWGRGLAAIDGIPEVVDVPEPPDVLGEVDVVGLGTFIEQVSHEHDEVGWVGRVSPWVGFCQVAVRVPPSDPTPWPLVQVALDLGVGDEQYSQRVIWNRWNQGLQPNRRN